MSVCCCSLAGTGACRTCTNNSFGEGYRRFDPSKTFWMPVAQKGWECPKCGAVLAPSVPACFNCKGVTND